MPKEKSFDYISKIEVKYWGHSEGGGRYKSPPSEIFDVKNNKAVWPFPYAKDQEYNERQYKELANFLLEGSPLEFEDDPHTKTQQIWKIILENAIKNAFTTHKLNYNAIASIIQSTIRSLPIPNNNVLGNANLDKLNTNNNAFVNANPNNNGLAIADPNKPNPYNNIFKFGNAGPNKPNNNNNISNIKFGPNKPNNINNIKFGNAVPNKPNPNNNNPIPNNSPLINTKPRDSENNNATEIPYSTIQLETKLGQGGFGAVYSGTCSFFGGQKVAIKKLLVNEMPDDVYKEFYREVKVMSQLKSPNTIQLYGICKSPYCMIMELASGGSLSSKLYSNTPLTWKDKEKFAFDIASGLTYLHLQKIIHCDLKSANVLIEQRGDSWTAKLADFGLTKIKSSTASVTTSQGVGGTLAFMAPELFTPGAKQTTQSDMYAYGILLWEICERTFPYSGTPQNLLAMWVIGGHRPEPPKNAPEKFSKLMQRCWDKNPQTRPSAQECANIFKI